MAKRKRSKTTARRATRSRFPSMTSTPRGGNRPSDRNDPKSGR